MQRPSISHSYGIVGTLCLRIREGTAMAAIAILHEIFDAFVSYRLRQAAAQAERTRSRTSSQSTCTP
jgi:hypothetical protein